MKILAIIPARGGSKGVPKKNVKLLGGKPLIAHAIECALGTKLISKVVVTTDDEEIAAVAKQYDVSLIMRPLELASDSSNVTTAVEHAYGLLNESFDVIILLQPTSPLRTSKDINNIVAILEKNPTVEGVISVIALNDTHPARMYHLSNKNNLIPLNEQDESKRRQDLDAVYLRNGCFYVVKTKALFEQKSFMVKNKMAYVMDSNWQCNIDTIRDFKLATLLYEDWKNEITDN